MIKICKKNQPRRFKHHFQKFSNNFSKQTPIQIMNVTEWTIFFIKWKVFSSKLSSVDKIISYRIEHERGAFTKLIFQYFTYKLGDSRAFLQTVTNFYVSAYEKEWYRIIFRCFLSVIFSNWTPLSGISKFHITLWIIF